MFDVHKIGTVFVVQKSIISICVVRKLKEEFPVFLCPTDLDNLESEMATRFLSSSSDWLDDYIRFWDADRFLILFVSWNRETPMSGLLLISYLSSSSRYYSLYLPKILNMLKFLKLSHLYSIRVPASKKYTFIEKSFMKYTKL